MAALGGQALADLGWSYGTQSRRLFAFSLQGGLPVPRQAAPQVPTPLASSDFIFDLSLVNQGAINYGERCNFCHGGGVISAGMAPDLRASGVVLSAQAFAQVVRASARSENGMPPFTKLSDQQLESIRHYIRRQADLALATQ